MRKILDQYIQNIGDDSYIKNTNDIYFHIDDFLFYISEYKKLRLDIDNYILQGEGTDTIDPDYSKLLTNNIKSFFILFIIEIAKLLETDATFENQINGSISIVAYERLKRHTPTPVLTISDQIRHFRDACVHHRDEEISKWPEFKEFNLSGDLHLDPTHDYKTHTPVFMVGHGKFEVATIERIIKEVCTYNGIKINL